MKKKQLRMYAHCLTDVIQLPCIYTYQVYCNCQNVNVTYVPGSLSSIVMNEVLDEPISTKPGWSVEVITTLKYSDSSVVLSSTVDTIKVAYCWPALKLTVYGPAS